MSYNVNDSLDNLGNFQTNKDQTVGEVIAKAAFLIAQGAHRNRPCAVHGQFATCDPRCPGREGKPKSSLEE